MNWGFFGYAIACIVTPVIWGLVVVWASRKLEQAVQKRRSASSPATEEAPLPPIEYHI